MATVEEKQKPILNASTGNYERKVFVYNTDEDGNTIAPPVSKRVEVLTQEQVDDFFNNHPEFLRSQTILRVDDVLTCFVVANPDNPAEPITTVENFVMRNKFLSVPDVQVWLSRGTEVSISKEVIRNVNAVIDLCAQVDPTAPDMQNSSPILSGVPLQQLRDLMAAKLAELNTPV